jgi:hypothetical protein
VLFVVAMVTLVFLVAIEALASLAVETRRARDGARFEADARSLEARIAFLAATRPLSSAAILRDGQPGSPALLGLDGRPYEAAPGLSAEVQDEAGLINLDNLPVVAVPRLFAALGVAPGWQSAMADRFEDFVDPTDVKRPQGADTEDYVHAGLPPPAKGPLTRRDQLEGVMGWHALVPASAWRAFEANVTADPRSSEVNVNTATPGMLEVVYGLTPAQARLAIATRNQAAFSELEDLGRAAGVGGLHSDAERPDTVPNGRFALRIADAAAHRGYRARLLLSPDDPARPFYVVEAAAGALTPAEIAALPDHAPQLP